jgi:hypothetical protein
MMRFFTPLTPALSPRRGEREHYGWSISIPSPPTRERVRVRGNEIAVPLVNRYVIVFKKLTISSICYGTRKISL